MDKNVRFTEKIKGTMVAIDIENGCKVSLYVDDSFVWVDMSKEEMRELSMMLDEVLEEME